MSRGLAVGRDGTRPPTAAGSLGQFPPSADPACQPLLARGTPSASFRLRSSHAAGLYLCVFCTESSRPATTTASALWPVPGLLDTGPGHLSGARICRLGGPRRTFL